MQGIGPEVRVEPGHYVLHLLEDTPKVMQRINELLKPGGLILDQYINASKEFERNKGRE